MNPKLRKTLIILNVAVIVFCLIGILNDVFQERQAKKIYAETQNLVLLPDEIIYDNQNTAPDENESQAPDTEEENIPTDTYAESLLEMSFDELLSKNEDVIGWIIIPDTTISYPIIQGKDNKYYLRRAWTGERNNAGCIFLDYQLSDNFDDFNSILYGHRMRNGTMFAPLANYEDEEFLKSHPSVYIVKEDKVLRYDIFAAYEASVKTKEAYQRVFENDDEKESYISFCKESSVFDSDLVPTPTSTILTLSTCTGNGYSTRWVVQGVLSYCVENTKSSD